MHLPDPLYRVRQERQVALVCRDDLLPVPLVPVGTVVVVEEVVLADGLHVGVDALAGAQSNCQSHPSSTSWLPGDPDPQLD